MAEGNPVLILERKEAVRTPPALWIQGHPDDHPHDYRDPEFGVRGQRAGSLCAPVPRGRRLDRRWCPWIRRGGPRS